MYFGVILIEHGVWKPWEGFKFVDFFDFVFDWAQQLDHCFDIFFDLLLVFLKNSIFPSLPALRVPT